MSEPSVVAVKHQLNSHRSVLFAETDNLTLFGRNKFNETSLEDVADVFLGNAANSTIIDELMNYEQTEKI